MDEQKLNDDQAVVDAAQAKLAADQAAVSADEDTLAAAQTQLATDQATANQEATAAQAAADAEAAAVEAHPILGVLDELLLATNQLAIQVSHDVATKFLELIAKARALVN